MEALEQYLFSILATALFCSVIQLFPLSGTTMEISKLICGLVITISVLSPLRKHNLIRVPNVLSDISSSAEDIAAEGEWSAKHAMATLIKDESEAYIRNKAAELGTIISVCIRLNDDPIPTPVFATVTGQLSGHIRTQLETAMTSDLGIAKENITWIG